MGWWRSTWLAVASCATISACGTDSDPPTTVPDERSFIYEHEFAADRTLAALRQHVVVLALGDAAAASSEHVVPQRLDGGEYRFCFEADERVLLTMTVEDDAGRPLASVDRTTACASVTLAEGRYRLRLRHDAAAVGTQGRVAFVRTVLADPKLVDAGGVVAGGWWAMQSDPADDPLGRRRTGRITMLPSGTGTARSMAVDFASQQFDDASLFKVAPTDVVPLATLGNTAVAPVNDSDNKSFRLVGGTTPLKTLTVAEQGAGRVFLGTSDYGNTPSNFFVFGRNDLPRQPPSSIGGNVDPRAPPAYEPRPFQVLFRFYPDGTKVPPLRDGEVALYQQCNYAGRAIVLSGDLPDLAALSSPATTIDQSARSVRLGNNTAVFLNSGPLYTGTRTLIPVDTPCLAAATTRSVLARPLVNVITASADCAGCRLAGVDLSNRDLANTKFTGADLTGANLHHATLTTAGFGRALLVGTDLGIATLDGANFNGANLANASLAGASVRNAAQFVGAHLKNANLAGSVLSGANFSNANFYGDRDAATTGTCQTDTSTCAATKTGFTCHCASAAGATIDGANFANAYLYGVDFTGATPLTNVNFGGAVLVSASFAGRTITQSKDSTSTSNFASAYLHGTLLAGAILDGTTLTNASVDFNSQGNDLSIVLSAQHTLYVGSNLSGPVCVNPVYGNATTVPNPTAATVFCPDGNRYNGGCGRPAPDGSNAAWKGGVPLDLLGTPGWYDPQSPPPTFPTAKPSPVCNGLPVNAGW